MQIARDLFNGTAPIDTPMIYNGDVGADGTSTRYKGSLCKLMDFDDIDNGTFVTFAGETTAMENVVGILAEDVTSGGSCVLPNDASADFVRKKVIPICNTTLIMGEYGRVDAAGTATTDTGVYTATASATVVAPTLTDTDDCIGGWVYFLTGNNAGYLHYIIDNDTTTTMTFGTATAFAGATGDTCLVIRPPFTNLLDFDATFTGLKSEIVKGSCSETVQGLDYYVKSPALPLQKLTRGLDGSNLGTKAQFYHMFTIPSAAAGANAWNSGIALS